MNKRQGENWGRGKVTRMRQGGLTWTPVKEEHEEGLDEDKETLIVMEAHCKDMIVYIHVRKVETTKWWEGASETERQRATIEKKELEHILYEAWDCETEREDGHSELAQVYKATVKWHNSLASMEAAKQRTEAGGGPHNTQGGKEGGKGRGKAKACGKGKQDTGEKSKGGRASMATEKDAASLTTQQQPAASAAVPAAAAPAAEAAVEAAAATTAAGGKATKASAFTAGKAAAAAAARAAAAAAPAAAAVAEVPAAATAQSGAGKSYYAGKGKGKTKGSGKSKKAGKTPFKSGNKAKCEHGMYSVGRDRWVGASGWGSAGVWGW